MSLLPGELKPLLTALILPPASPLLLLAAGALLRRASRRALAGMGSLVMAASAIGLWLLACQAVSVPLARSLLPQPSVATPDLLARRQVQAIVVLGGGIEPLAPEYGRAEPSLPTLQRLRHGAHLARATGLPLAFAGGVGWANQGTGVASEAQAAEAVLRDWGQAMRWRDDQSRDTAENAARLRALLAPAGIRRIALVSQAWHLPRAQRLFEAQGFEVVPAPTGFIQPSGQAWLRWVPDAGSLQDSRAVLREWLALRLL